LYADTILPAQKSLLLEKIKAGDVTNSFNHLKIGGMSSGFVPLPVHAALCAFADKEQYADLGACAPPKQHITAESCRRLQIFAVPEPLIAHEDGRRDTNAVPPKAHE
jgi:hypothetical protein